MAYLYPFERRQLRQLLIDVYRKNNPQSEVDFDLRNARAFEPVEAEIRRVCTPLRMEVPGSSFLRDFFSDARNLNDNFIDALYFYATGDCRPQITEQQEINWKEDWAEILNSSGRIQELEARIQTLQSELDQKQAPDTSTNPPAGFSQLRRTLPWIIAALCFTWALWLTLCQPEAVVIKSPDYTLETLASGDYNNPDSLLGKTHFYFRMRDSSHTLWPYLQVSFYNFKEKTTQNVWGVEAEGLYRDTKSELQNPAQPDRSIKHRGIVVRIDPTHYQMILRPVDASHFMRYGYWFSSFRADYDLKQMCAGNTKNYGIGSGISNYPNNDEQIDKLSSYVFQINNESLNFGDTTMKSILKNLCDRVDPQQDTSTSKLRTALYTK
jgi:hypothetical protein